MCVQHCYDYLPQTTVNCLIYCVNTRCSVSWETVKKKTKFSTWTMIYMLAILILEHMFCLQFYLVYYYFLYRAMSQSHLMTLYTSNVALQIPTTIGNNSNDNKVKQEVQQWRWKYFRKGLLNPFRKKTRLWMGLNYTFSYNLYHQWWRGITVKLKHALSTCWDVAVQRLESG